jgi:histidyl-tRNA synthetase
LDAEVILLLVELLRGLGIPEYELHLNSLGCPECRQAYREALRAYFLPAEGQLCADCRSRLHKNPLRLLDCKQEACRPLVGGAPAMREFLCDGCAAHYAEVQKTLDLYGIAYSQDDHLVRGLDYYTNTAFEIHLPGMGAQSAIGGGGRYNGLIAGCGGPDMPGVGFAVGLERLLLAVGWEAAAPKLDAFIITTGGAYFTAAAQLAQTLREAGLKVDLDYMGRSLKAQMKYANKTGAELALILGEDEIREEKVTVKQMESGQQAVLPLMGIAPGLRELLNNREEII